MPVTQPSNPDHILGEDGSVTGYFNCLSSHPYDAGYILRHLPSNRVLVTP
jgi:hypothetical protein